MTTSRSRLAFLAAAPPWLRRKVPALRLRLFVDVLQLRALPRRASRTRAVSCLAFGAEARCRRAEDSGDGAGGGELAREARRKTRSPSSAAAREREREREIRRVLRLHAAHHVALGLLSGHAAHHVAHHVALVGLIRCGRRGRVGSGVVHLHVLRVLARETRARTSPCAAAKFGRELLRRRAGLEGHAREGLSALAAAEPCPDRGAGTGAGSPAVF